MCFVFWSFWLIYQYLQTNWLKRLLGGSLSVVRRSSTVSPVRANICEKVPGTDGSGEARRDEIGVGYLGRGSQPTPHQLGDLGERCKLLQQGLGRSHSRY